MRGTGIWSNTHDFVRIYFQLRKLHPLSVNLFSVHAKFRRSSNAEPDFVSIHHQNRDSDATINHNLLANFP